MLLALGGLGVGALHAPVAYANPDQLFLRNTTSTVNAADQTLDIQGSAAAAKTLKGWSVVQPPGTVTSNGATVLTTYTITLPGVTAGNRLIIAANQDDAPGTGTVSISDSGGNSYSQIQMVRNALAAQNGCSSPYNTYNFTAQVTTGGTLTITATISPGSADFAMSATEVSGLDTSGGVGSVDVSAGATYSDTATTHSSGTSAGTTIAADEFAFATYADKGCNLTISAGNVGNPATAATKGASNDPQAVSEALTVEYGNSGNASTTQSATFTNSAPGAKTTLFTIVLSVFKLATTSTWLTATSYPSGSVATGYTFTLDFASNTCTTAAPCTVTVTWGFCNSGCTTLQAPAATFTFTLNTASGASGSVTSTVTGSPITLAGCPCNFYVQISSLGTPTWNLAYSGPTAAVNDTNISTPVLPVPERLLPLLGLALLIPALLGSRRLRVGEWRWRA